jgi:hypothetical protein
MDKRLLLLPVERSHIVMNMMFNDRLYLYKDETNRCGNVQPQHLYEVSEETPVVGDWVYDGNQVYLKNTDRGKNEKKITGSTDRKIVSDRIRLISRDEVIAFMETYNLHIDSKNKSA